MTTQQKPAPAVGQRWKWEAGGYSSCLREWFEVGERHEGRAWKIARCSEGCVGHSFFEDMRFTNGELTYLSPPPGPVGGQWAVGQRRRGKLFGNNDGTILEYEGEYVVLGASARPGTGFDTIVECADNKSHHGAMFTWPSELLSGPATPAEPVAPATGRLKALLEHTDLGQAGVQRDSAAEPVFLGLDAWLPKPDDKFVVSPEFRYGVTSPSFNRVYLDDDKPAKPVLREVGAGPNGPWLPYDSLVDSDPFTSYRHRRENAVVVALEDGGGFCDFSDPYAVIVAQCPTKTVTQVCRHCGESSPPEPFNCKPKDWRGHNEMLDRALTDSRSAANPVTAPPSPISATPGSTIPQTRAYRTPSGESK